MTRFVLASGSPGRLATLRRAGLRPEVIVSDVDEAVPIEDPAELVEHLAIAKALAVAGRLTGAALVLGCDSLLDVDGTAVGKPRTAERAVAQWRAMRGRTAVLRTGHALVDVANDRARSAVVATTVSFADVTDAEIAGYVATGEPLDCAGAFTIDGLGGWFVSGVGGDPHNVVGVSLPTLRVLLGRLGYTLADVGYPTVTEPID